MGIAISLLLIAAGAICAFAVTAHTNGINIHTVGWILMVIGILGLVLTVIFWNSWFGAGMWRRRYVATEGGYPPPDAAYPPQQRRRTVVEEDAGGPAPPPP